MRIAWLVLAACNNAPVASDARVADAAVADARPLGMIDGQCVGLPGKPRILVYTYENLFRHLSNYYARAAIFEMCTTRGFSVVTTNDPRSINATRLAETDVVVLAVTSGQGLDAAGRADFEAWVRAGGGVVGFEAAAATEMEWPFFVANIGVAFRGHPPGLQQGTVRIDTSHPITAGMPATMEFLEQWYVFQGRPEDVPGLRVLMDLDESTLGPDYPDDYRVGYHALGWVHEPFGGRVFYTGLGDQPDTFANPAVLEMTARAIEWTARQL